MKYENNKIVKNMVVHALKEILVHGRKPYTLENDGKKGFFNELPINQSRELLEKREDIINKFIECLEIQVDIADGLECAMKICINKITEEESIKEHIERVVIHGGYEVAVSGEKSDFFILMSWVLSIPMLINYRLGVLYGKVIE